MDRKPYIIFVWIVYVMGLFTGAMMMGIVGFIRGWF